LRPNQRCAHGRAYRARAPALTSALTPALAPALAPTQLRRPRAHRCEVDGARGRGKRALAQHARRGLEAEREQRNGQLALLVQHAVAILVEGREDAAQLRDAALVRAAAQRRGRALARAHARRGRRELGLRRGAAAAVARRGHGAAEPRRRRRARCRREGGPHLESKAAEKAQLVVSAATPLWPSAR
jgi:hypothetical protein